MAKWDGKERRGGMRTATDGSAAGAAFLDEPLLGLQPLGRDLNVSLEIIGRVVVKQAGFGLYGGGIADDGRSGQPHIWIELQDEAPQRNAVYRLEIIQIGATDSESKGRKKTYIAIKDGKLIFELIYGVTALLEQDGLHITFDSVLCANVLAEVLLLPDDWSWIRDTPEGRMAHVEALDDGMFGKPSLPPDKK